jgi:predicted AAA+ superfamily ATPase
MRGEHRHQVGRSLCWSAGILKPYRGQRSRYWNDTGLSALLLGVTVDRLKGEGNVAGSVLENFVLMEPRKQCAWSANRPELFYWRTASGREVDIVLEDRTGRVVDVEVKAAATLGRNDVGGLLALESAVGKNWVRGVVLTEERRSSPFRPICTVFRSADFGWRDDRGS